MISKLMQISIKNHLLCCPKKSIIGKIIDVAYKYGYETPESFTKAFSKFHGLTPSKVKKGEDILVVKFLKE